MILYGGSGHAKVILDCLYAQGISVKGLFDDNPNLAHFRDIELWGAYDPEIEPDDKLIIAIGNNSLRHTIAQQVKHAFGKAVHPSATLSRYIKPIGDGTVIFHQSVVQADCVIGKQCIINTAATVDHDCRLGDFVHISPNATLCGNVTIGEGTHIGASVTIIPGVTIGNWCTIGAGAVVTRDIPDYSVAMGIPARVIRQNKQDYQFLSEK